MNMTKISTLMLVATLAVSGCSTIKGWTGKRDNGSLDYQKSHKLDPIKLPANQRSAEFVPLYPTPAVGQNTLDITNESGSQYALPKPPKVQ